MKLIELHILQSFPVTCLNRDDLGSPKSAVFGGVTRARLSSQCMKRAIRQFARDTCPEFFQGQRSRLIIDPIKEVVKSHGIAEDVALSAAIDLAHYLATFDKSSNQSKGMHKVKTLLYLAPSEIAEAGKRLAEAINSGYKPVGLKTKDDKDGDGKKNRKIGDIAKKLAYLDAADIALFGRMVAADHSLTVEGAALFSHALSTHRAENDVDFFTAVDDRQKDDPSVQDEDRAGSGMMGSLEYNSATYYRYVGLNLGLLFDQGHLQAIDSPESRKQILNAFLQACLMAVPGARQNSMNGHTLPGYVLGVARDQGHPLQMVNAFEKPVKAGPHGLLAPSIEKLKEHAEQMKKTWDLQYAVEVAMPDKTAAEFCQALTGHAVR